MNITKIIIEKLVKYALKEISPVFVNKKALMRFEDQVLPDYLKRAENDNLNIRTFLHRSTPTKLYNVYQSIKLKSYNGVICSDDITSLFDHTNYISIIGRAGSGKSILINHFLLSCIAKEFRIPVKICLRKVKEKGFSIEEEIAKSIYIRTPSLELVKTLLIEGKFLLLFDGYDEISLTSHIPFNDHFVDFLSKYTKNKFILTSRPYAGSENLPKFSRYTIRNFSREEIANFIEKQIKDQNVSSNIISSVKRCSQNYIKSYLSNPLLLSIFILISRTTTKIPTKQHFFYRKVIDALFEEHDALSKSGHARELASGLGQEEIERILQLFSLFSYFSQKIFFDKRYFFRNLNKIRRLNKKNETGVNIPDFTNNQFLRDLKVPIALLIDDDGQLSFIHRSIQEFFIVSLIYNLDRYDSKKDMYKKILILVQNRKSYEIHTLLSLFSEMDKTNYYKFLLQPAMKHIKNNIFDNTGESLYGPLMKFLFNDFYIRFNPETAANDNYFKLNHTWLFPIEHLKPFGLLINHIRQLLNTIVFSQEINSLKKCDSKNICNLLIKNKITKELLIALFDAIVEYSKEINEYIANSDSFNQEVVDMLECNLETEQVT